MENIKTSLRIGENKMTTISEEEENYVRMSLLLSGISPRAVRVLLDNEFHPLHLNVTIKKETNKLIDLKKKKIINQSQWEILFPRNDQISTTLEAWTLDDSNLVETKAANYVLKCIQEHSCVTITACSGVGKTVTLRHVALQMAADGYNVLPVTNPHDIVKFNNPNEKTLFVIDDFCGTYSLNQSDVNSFESVSESIKELLIQNVTTKIIVACRLQVYQDEKFDFLSIFRTCECNLLSEDLCLSQPENQSIAELYLKEKTPEIIQTCDLYDCFPLLCKLYKENPKPNIISFFQNPFSVYRLEIDKLHTNKHFGKYCALALCVMFNNKLEEKMFTDEIDKETRKRIKNTCEACRLDRGTSRLILLDEINSLILTFMRKELDVYKTIHDKIFDFLAYYFGQKMIQCLIENADMAIIGKRFLQEKNDDMDQNITIVPPKYHQMYINRMIDDWSKGIVVHVFLNINLLIPKFRQRFLCYLNKLDISFQRRLALTRDVLNEDTVLSYCCYLSSIPLIKWCIKHGVDVNEGNRDGVTPLIMAANNGKKEVVQLLLDNKANINKCKDNGESPLFFACPHNNIEVLKILLDNKADINKFRDDGVSPLIIACNENYPEIVKLLLENKADINKSADKSGSPLFLACQNNHKEIVKLLLENNANINKCANNGESPLFVACKKNHTEIVKVLLDSKAEINNGANYGMSPLISACAHNYIVLVNVLLENKADVNKCTTNRETPLFIACYNNRVDVVNILLNSKAEVNTCDKFETSPLLIACQNNCIEIVKILLKNNADINKCMDNGMSPLYVACHNKRIEIVKILLDNKAYINQCCDDGSSPLCIACKNNYISVVRILLDNNADINNCMNDGATPLFIACLKGHIELVSALVACKADIDKCANDGATPLFIACQKNHKEIVKVLLDNKADINKCTFSGSFPLLVSYMSHHKDIVEMLVQNGADCNTLFAMMFQLVASYY
ncbi:Hypothetical predicted protein [Mytilus galloprovincialis]|uniref:Novel STAND NTPase 3 domain-containing protein n=1 Tax=Mytilus galloprovincialis TaxID=29158 RepID=A0A8B6H9A6_MYTGA|nr:Hypothetical predicted protein [Mytilus galloprovincialis]